MPFLTLALVILLPTLTFLPTRVGGGNNAISNSTSLAIDNPEPILSTISPTSVTTGSATFTLTVTGTNFVNSSVIRFNGVDHLTTFVNITKLTVQITAQDIQAAGTFPITVFNPAPGGGSSSPIDFSVYNPMPPLLMISPMSVMAGRTAFVLTVSGGNFNSSSVVRFNGSDRITTLGANPIDDTHFFVWQQYLDLMNRMPDARGLDYWTWQVTQFRIHF